MDNYYLLLLCVGVLGLLVGSCLNLVIYRLPTIMMRNWEKDCYEYLKQIAPVRGEIFHLFSPKSYCHKCGGEISWWHNVAILRYLTLRGIHGDCRFCSADIHWRYLLVELLSAVLSVIVVMYFSYTIQALAILVLTWTLIAAVFIDIDHQLLPDSMTVSLLWMGLLLNTYNIFTTPEDAIFGAALGYLVPWSIASVFKLVRKVEGMGEGDFKLLAAFGAWFGWRMVPSVLLLASIIGLIVGVTILLFKKHKLNTPMAFGPYLAIAGWLIIFYA